MSIPPKELSEFHKKNGEVYQNMKHRRYIKKSKQVKRGRIFTHLHLQHANRPNTQPKNKTRKRETSINQWNIIQPNITIPLQNLITLTF